MILSFDKFERYELPQVTLCNPNSRAKEVDGKITITDTVGVLSNPKGMNLKLNFNAPHELSFDYYWHKSSDPIKQSFYDSIYDAIQTDRYIYLTDIGYFVISSVTDSDEDNIDKKSISLKSCEENEFATAEGLYLEEGTYQLHTEDNKGLLDLFLPKTAGWTIGFIDPALLVKYDSETGEEKAVERYVEKTEVDNGYNFLYTTIQDMFECIVEPDIIKRTISAYSRAYYAEHHLTDIHIAKYNLLKHKTVEENDEDKYTALNVQGKDENLEIRTVNPTGKNVIYNFEPRYSWMSPALQDAVTRWQEKCESVEDEYLTLQQGYYNDMQNIVFPLEEDIKVLELQLKEKKQTRDTIIYGDYDKEKYDEIQDNALKQINTEIQNVSTQISDKKVQLETEKNKIETNYSQPISNINSDCDLDITAVDIDGNVIFTVDLLNELMTHIKPTDYIDEYMLVTESMTYPQRFEKTKELMNRAQSQLVKISSGQKTYSIDTRSFLFNKQFKHFSEQLCAGAIIYVETKSDIMEQLHLTSIDISFDEKSTNFTLGNKYDRSDLKALYEDALGQNSKSFSELKYIAGILEEQRKQLDYQRNWVADLRTLTLDNVLTSEDQAIEINNRGLIGRKRRLDENGEWDFDENGNPYFEPEQVKLINNTLVFTENNWSTASTAVGKIAVGYNSDGSVKYAYGINGQVLIGELILGNNLVLTGTGAGIKITDGSGKNAFYADENGNLTLCGTIYATDGKFEGEIIATEGKIGNWKIFDNYLGSDLGSVDTTTFLSLTGAEATFYTSADLKSTKKESCVIYNKGKFAVTTNGTLYAQDANIAGKITATSGDIGGWIIDNDILGNKFISGVVNGCSTGVAPGINTTTRKISTVKANGSTEGLCFWAGAAWSETSSDKDHVAISQAPFRVYSDGSLYASNAEISGTIKAGTIIGTLTNGLGGVECTSDGKFFIIKTPKLGKDSSPMVQLRLGEQNNKGYFLVRTSPTTSNSNRNTSEIRMEDDNIVLSCEDNWITIKGEQGEFHGNWQIGGVLVSNTNPQRFLNLNGDGGVLNLAGGNFNNRLALNAEGGRLWGNWSGTDNQAILSDINKKNTVTTISDKYSILFDNLYPVTYKYNHGTSDRLHTGFIAQEVKNALDIANIDTKDFAGLVIYNQDTEDEEWTLRYGEFIALNTWQIQRAKKRIVDLENTVAELKAQIQTLTAG